jgi:hypothetical protein
MDLQLMGTFWIRDLGPFGLIKEADAISYTVLHHVPDNGGLHCLVLAKLTTCP